ncbi:putative tetratricopeptide repeat protein 1 protein [Phaeoacremonium minimum UCRPA7]|uniref:Putative tetratricopeptide repeat protein 1 protein n=1 Tax=Phaeoacremonium minimum (strain UCR-PA7) TaxID=1286976 RepID=R8BYD6_PHAM7|nr:putative tetratricopeptide repeat protein 1 protein [Phaeoacremonium minimum UCRPA7]EOO04401.1 putative tetratricopeptide repeat protein 1 protein [Phaeoacremonium minimum UCRPA7]
MASTLYNGHVNGAPNGAANGAPTSKRFSDVPAVLDIPVRDQEDEAVEIDLMNLVDDPSDLCDLFETEQAARTYWMAVALAYAKLRRVDYAIEMLIRGGNAMQNINPRDKLSMTPSSSGPAGSADADKAELLRNALKSFEDAIRVSQGKNMLATMGKARVLFSMGKYPDALSAYQEVLRKMPDLVDPDPRIGIGCCFWQLGFKDDAKSAWERSYEINPDSKVANILLGLYYLDSSGRVPINSPEFIRLYKKAMTEYTHKSFKLDSNLPLTNATFAGYFLSKKNFDNVDKLAHKAIQFTDVNAIASDGWYLLARKEHINGDVERAKEFYKRADDARGGDERGYLPAKFGIAQLAVLKNEMGDARYHLDRIISKSKSYEAMALLGILYAEEVFANQEAAGRDENVTEQMRRAVSLLENVRSAWKDPKKNLSPDASVLLNLARLYEIEHPEKALQCLQQVEQLEIDQIPQSDYPSDVEDEAAVHAELRKFLPPQLLNNIGCFYSQAEKHELASDLFQAALGACIRIGEKDETLDTDALVTTISFNLGRSYESRGLTDKAIEVYEGLLKRHDDYTDARIRLAYLKLRTTPGQDGPDAVAKLYQEHPTDLDVRALYAWFRGKSSRKRPGSLGNPNDDPEGHVYKRTLQNHDKHDRYALVGMGNLWLMVAREMRRDTDAEKQKRSATYTKAVEFFDKALQVDPKNAYAAQGIAIALAEDKKDYKTALAIFSKVRDTVRDAHVFVNMGHTHSELGQFSKAIECYEIALSKDGKSNDSNILACLGRTWLNKARKEKNLDAYKSALECAKKTLEAAPEQLHFKFNIAFVQIQLASFIVNIKEHERTLQQLEDAAEGLEAAITSLDEISTQPQTPYPKHDIEQRANMARNTQRKQLERAIAAQKEYEEKNKEKLAAALEQRQAELRRREEERQKALDKERERQEKIRKEREEIAARDKVMAEQRAEEERARQAAEMTTDSETGEKVKRKRKPAPKSSGEPRQKGRSRRKKPEDGDESEEERQPKPKKRRLGKKESSKYKSAELVADSDDDSDVLDAADRVSARDDTPASPISDVPTPKSDDQMDVDNEARDDEDEEGTVGRRQQSKRSRRGRIVSDDEDEEDEGPASPINGDDAASPGGGYESPPADTSMADAGDDDDE